MTVQEFNEKFLRGQIDDKYIQIRSMGLINLDCNHCHSNIQQKPPSESTIYQNCHSYFWDCVCNFCGANVSRRTALSPFDALDEDETTRITYVTPRT